MNNRGEKSRRGKGEFGGSKPPRIFVEIINFLELKDRARLFNVRDDELTISSVSAPLLIAHTDEEQLTHPPSRGSPR